MFHKEVGNGSGFEEISGYYALSLIHNSKQIFKATICNEKHLGQVTTFIKVGLMVFSVKCTFLFVDCCVLSLSVWSIFKEPFSFSLQFFAWFNVSQVWERGSGGRSNVSK